MPDFCTCGAELPPDARFCHKCGKPQREELPEAAEAAAPVVALPPPVEIAGRIDFHNPTAIRVAFLAASLVWLLFLVPLLGFGLPLWLPGAGFFSVYMYRRRTGQKLDVRSGVRMGWLTGIFTFVIGTVFYTLVIVSISMTSGGFAAAYRKGLSSMGNMGMSSQDMKQALEMAQTPAAIVSAIVFLLVLFFVIVTLLSVLGGALGARMLSKERGAGT